MKYAHSIPAPRDRPRSEAGHERLTSRPPRGEARLEYAGGSLLSSIVSTLLTRSHSEHTTVRILITCPIAIILGALWLCVVFVVLGRITPSQAEFAAGVRIGWRHLKAFDVCVLVYAIAKTCHYGMLAVHANREGVYCLRVLPMGHDTVTSRGSR